MACSKIVVQVPCVSFDTAGLNSMGFVEPKILAE